MKLDPFYERAFREEDFLGHLDWDDLKFTGPIVRYAFTDEVHKMLKEGRVIPSSIVEFDERQDIPAGLWTTLNEYTKGSTLGPLALKWRSSVLAGKRFEVFKGPAESEDSHRWALVETDQPRGQVVGRNEMFRIQPPSESHPDGEAWLRIAPRNHIYNLVLTSELRIWDATIAGVGGGLISEETAQENARKLGRKVLIGWLRQNEAFSMRVRQFEDFKQLRFDLTYGEDGPIVPKLVVD